MLRLILIAGMTLFAAITFAAEDEQSGKVDDYNQWKQALGSGKATDPKTISVPNGFEIELLRSAGPKEGSWISLTFDPQGRLIISREDRGLYRATLRSDDKTRRVAVENIEFIDDTLLECRGLLWAYDALYANANNSKGLYRLRYLAEEDKYAAPELLQATAGGVGHGRNDLALGPDGFIYSIHGDDAQLPTDFRPESSPLRNYTDARVLPCTLDDQLFNGSMKLPGGHVVRTDRDGKKWELVAGGLRNPYGLDFNSDGELFTYDADMEWDVGMPWYRPTRVLHLVSGGDFGWRRGTGTYRAWYPDSLPAAADIGLGSPTAVMFGTRSQFPEPYRNALFILEWAYGKILAVHLTPRGASYEASFEPFISGRPLNVTDLTFGPDGAMYFLTGGRKTQSGLYRVSYVGKERKLPSVVGSGQASDVPNAHTQRELRRQLEGLHGNVDRDAVTKVWPHLASDDAWIRHAARVAIELQPVSQWRTKALAETHSLGSVTALLALARVAESADRDLLLERLLDLPWDSIGTVERTTLARALSLAVARLGLPDGELRQRMTELLEHRFPDLATEVNQQLCELLVALQSTQVVSKTALLIPAAKTQEERLHYIIALRGTKHGWTPATRRAYIEWVRQVEGFYGAQYLPRYVRWLKDEVLASFTAEEKTQFADLLERPIVEATTAPMLQRAHVRTWQFDDLAGSLDAVANGRNLEQGKTVFAAALCIRCHRMGTSGSPIGPDLTQVARRFGRRDLLLSILAPSHVIDEKYRGTTITTHSGKILVGQITNETESELTVVSDMLTPDSVTRISVNDVESRLPSLVSPMPSGLLNSFTKEEILDLLAYLEANR